MKPAPHAGGVRLQRVLADAGVAARRACEALIESGHVAVNGKVVTRLPVFVDPDTDVITVNGRPVQHSSRRIYVMLHKPGSTLVTSTDEPGSGRRTVSDLVDHPGADRLFPVGRLDYETTGLVLLTNDGGLANRLTHPRYEVPKTYHAVVRGPVEAAAIDAIAAKLRTAGLDDTEGPRRPRGRAPEIRVVRQEGANTVLEFVMVEAHNRELRDVMRYLGMPIKKLTRVAIGGLELRNLGLGQWRELTRDEVRTLREKGPPKPRPARTGPPSRRGPGPARGAPERRDRGSRPARGGRGDRAGGERAGGERPEGRRSGGVRPEGGRPEGGRRRGRGGAR